MLPNLRRALVALALVLLSFAAAATETGTIPIGEPKDMVHDAKRNLVYLTDGGYVRRYDLATGKFLAPFLLYGTLRGIDISPDDNTLAVADATSAQGDLWVHLIDLQTGQARKSMIYKAFYEGGSYAVQFVANGDLVMTSSFNGSGWTPMRRLVLATDTWSVLGDVRQDSMISASGNGRYIAYAESNISDGRWGKFDSQTGIWVRREWYENGTSQFNFEIATNNDASGYAINGTLLYDGVYQKAGSVPGAMAAAYAPVANVAYFPIYNTDRVEVHNMNTHKRVGYYLVGKYFGYGGAFGQGRTRVSRDGSLLMVQVAGGVWYRRMYAPLVAADVRAATLSVTPVAIPLQGSIGSGVALAYGIAKAPAHGKVTVSGNTATYTPAAGFAGTDVFTYRVVYGRATVTAIAEVAVLRQGNRAPVTKADEVATPKDTSVLAAVLANDTDPDGDTLRITSLAARDGAIASIEGTQVRFTPAAGFVGTSYVKYGISDGRGGTASGLLTVYVGP
jgi:hypothetical protein